MQYWWQVVGQNAVTVLWCIGVEKLLGMIGKDGGGGMRSGRPCGLILCGDAINWGSRSWMGKLSVEGNIAENGICRQLGVDAQ